ncbi:MULTISPECIES: IMPACT family protein [unclassified Helicobacter]|uniref:IMPACT family protein n=1 Tax=unclassified Helicobacter TaxID=2593540 RepID=UPI000CF05C2F|nr:MULTISPECIES: YigZ family protein [unclassified Helicobacter]
MKIISQEIFNSIEVKKSVFLGFVFSSDLFEMKMRDLKQEHPKAVHFVYAYRLMEKGQIVERFSDDGEPKGSSGMPMLNVLRGYDLINSAAIVVRYFGGTLLGVGGLVRAYTQSVVSCIKDAQTRCLLKDYVIQKQEEIQCPYALLNKVEYIAKTLGIEITKDNFGADSVVLRVCGMQEKLDIFLSKYYDLQHNLGG